MTSVVQSACEGETAAGILGSGGRVEDMDLELLQDQTDSVCEELRRRGACTTLALARHLGFEKSSCINSLMALLREKNIVVSLSDVPPIWSLAPTFPMNPYFDQGQCLPTARALGSFGSTEYGPASRQNFCKYGPATAPSTSGRAVSCSLTSSGSPSTLVSIPTSTSLCRPVSSALLAAQLTSPTIPSSPSVPAPNSGVQHQTPEFKATPTTRVQSFRQDLCSDSAVVAMASHQVDSRISLQSATNVSRAPTMSQDSARVALTSLTSQGHIIPGPQSDAVKKEWAYGADETVPVRSTQKSPLSLTSQEHIIPGPQSDAVKKEWAYGADETVPVRSNQKSPLPALTFSEHLVPFQPQHEANATVQRSDQARGLRSNFANGRDDRANQKFGISSRPTINGIESSPKRQKVGDKLTELQLKILLRLGEMGPSEALDLARRLGFGSGSAVKPALYDLLRKDLLIRSLDTPVIWQLKDG